jgi:predicted AlkP superfamily phosphohydrolase/phosphomutase
VPAPTRVLVVAFDAADRTLATRLAGEGRMPALRSLLGQGRSVDVDSPYGLFVGAVWPTFLTGCNAGRHGRYCFGQLVPGKYEVRRTAGGYPQPPFWSKLNEADRRVAVIDVPHSPWPEPDFHGVQIVDWIRHDPNIGLFTSPPALADELTTRFTARDLCDHYAKRGAYGRLRDDLLDGISRKTELCESLLADSGWDVFLVVFSPSHCVGHHFWAAHDASHPRHDPAVVNVLGDPMVDVYEAEDAALGRLLDQVGNDTIVMLLLSHGMGPHYDATFLLGEMLRRIGRRSSYSRGRLVRQGARRAAGRLTRRKQGTEPGAFMWYVDGGRRFFPIPNNDVCGAIRVNVRGREPAGQVAAGREFDETCAMLESELATWTNLDTGEPLVPRVVRIEECYAGPERAQLPDLLVEWNRTAPIRSIGAPHYGRIDQEYSGFRTGDHVPGGLLVARGPGIRPGRRADAISMADLAPTIAAGADVDLPDVDGTAQPIWSDPRCVPDGR